MQPAESRDVTRLLGEAAAGRSTAADELFAVVYEQLRALAGSYFRGQGAAHTLQPTALVHEAFVKLVREDVGVRDRQHFFALAATVMRQILVDHARGKQREKRGGDWQRVSLTGVMLGSAVSPVDLLALDEALQRLAAIDASRARLVELRFFAGLDEGEAADVLQISRATASRAWRFARAWLIRELWPEQAAE